MKKIKRKYNKKIKKPIAKYIGDAEILFSQFKKIVNKGDLVPEVPLKEARARSDFIIENERKD